MREGEREGGGYDSAPPQDNARINYIAIKRSEIIYFIVVCFKAIIHR